jgi:endonuclease-3
MKLRSKSERDEILNEIFKLYPTKTIELDFETPFQLLAAVMLSAQMTDKGVNKATKKLFEIVKTPADLLKLQQEKVEVMLRGVNYYRVKTKHLFMTAEKLVHEHRGKIPHTLETIRTLPGVGVKTAKVVLSHLYDMPFIGVDTHIHRVMNRMGIVKTKTPEETDRKLEKLLSEDQKRTMHHAIVLFGRYICTAKKCKCPETPLAKWCGCEECGKNNSSYGNQ